LDDLTLADVRRLFLRAQRLLGAPDRSGGVPALLRALGLVQLDTISVLARSHELVAYARLGSVGRDAVERAYWSRPAVAFEYLGFILPIEEWPYLAARRRRRAAWVHPRRPHDQRALDEVRRILRERGPITSAELGGSRSKAPRPAKVWWHWSPLKIAVERLLAIGEVACVERRGWRRVYDLADRAVPRQLLRRELSDAACHQHLVRRAGERLGVAAVTELADYFGGMTPADVRAVIARTGLVPVRVRGWDEQAWADPAALAAAPRGRGRTTLLSPFDSLLRDRARTERLFGFDLRLEAYTPAPKRVHGYYAMPLLAAGRLVGRLDPGRSGTTLVAKRATLEPDAVEPMADALIEAASWVGCDAVAVGIVAPARLRAPLRAAISVRS